MHPPDCPPWRYDQHPKRVEVLARRVAEVLAELGAGRLSTIAAAVDSRPVHRRLFIELTPPGFDYYAGHYRGEDLRCLRHYRVQVNGDPNVGFDPGSVWIGMSQIERLIREGLALLDVNRDIPDAHLPRAQKILQVVVFACRIFELFLRVHPYADGNGHAARFLIWSVLVRYGYWPRRWPIEPRPPDPPYTQLIVEYRKGNCEPFEEFVLKSLA